MIGKGKRPRDPNQLAKWIVDQSTSEDPAARTCRDSSRTSEPVGVHGCNRARRRSDRREAPSKDHDEGRAVKGCGEGC